MVGSESDPTDQWQHEYPLERAALRCNRLGGSAHKATIAGNSPP